MTTGPSNGFGILYNSLTPFAYSRASWAKRRKRKKADQLLAAMNKRSRNGVDKRGSEETHASRISAAGIKPEAEGAALLLKRIKAGALADKDGVIAETFTTRDVYRKGWQGLGDVDAVRGAADMLVEYDWLRRELVPGSAAGGRPSEQYRINPAALGGGKP